MLRGAGAEVKKPRKRPDQIFFKTDFKNVIYEVFVSRGYKQTDHETLWDIIWADKDWICEYFDHIHFESGQRINHFRNFREMCRKDNLIKNMRRARRQLEKEHKMEEAALYSYCPTSFMLPGEYSLFVEEFKRDPGITWIAKPTGKAQGKGIFLFEKLHDVQKWKVDLRFKPEADGTAKQESYLAQKYIANPYLVGGKKFDLRLYVLVVSYLPLTVYMHRSGFCRFTNTRYDAEDTSDITAHLTNVAIQKHADDYDADTGGKWHVKQFRKYIAAKHGRPASDELFEKIQMIMMRAILSVQPVMMKDSHCFELYGFDVLIDSDLRPWILEVNASPSLTANTPEDRDMKFKILNDMLDIVDLEGKLKGIEPLVGGFDLVYYKDGLVNKNPNDRMKCKIGTDLPSRAEMLQAKRAASLLDAPARGAWARARAFPLQGRKAASSRAGERCRRGGGVARAARRRGSAPLSCSALGLPRSVR